jgi:nanoRNase/pAp phosphatase (c-di-AMP/oligoRNAs hydrolase)
MPAELDRSRKLSESIVEYMFGKGKILIVTHDNPDPDALAAAFALRHLIEVKAQELAIIAYSGVVGRVENRELINVFEIKTSRLEDLDLDDFGVVCMVDTQPGTGNNSFPHERDVHIVIDHHPLREQTKLCRIYDVREDYGAAATILYEYLLCQEVYVATKLATILFYAIKSETQDLGREWGLADKTAYLNLLQLSNNRLLFKITQAKVPAEYFALFNRAIENAKQYGPVLIFNLYDVHTPETVAEMADFLLRMQGIDYVLGIGRHEESAVLSLRTTSQEKFAGDILRAVVDDLGTAGGHGMTAGAQVTPMRGNGSLLREFEQTMTKRLLKVLNLPSCKGKGLVIESGR